ncbi:YdcH family protein [Novosphingobium sp. 11B]
MFRLLELHQKLDAAIRRMKTTRTADPIAIARMTKRKLRLKERLARLVAMPTALPGL